MICTFPYHIKGDKGRVYERRGLTFVTRIDIPRRSNRAIMRYFRRNGNYPDKHTITRQIAAMILKNWRRRDRQIEVA